jgi:hypothetical protein
MMTSEKLARSYRAGRRSLAGQRQEEVAAFSVVQLYLLEPEGKTRPAMGMARKGDTPLPRMWWNRGVSSTLGFSSWFL